MNVRQKWSRQFANDLPTPEQINFQDGSTMPGTAPYARLVVGFEAGLETGLDRAARFLEGLDNPALEGLPALIRAIGTAEVRTG